MVLDRDRGIWFDIEELEGNMETEYSLFPSKDELLASKEEDEENEENEDKFSAGGETSSSHSSLNRKSVREGLKRFSFKGFSLKSGDGGEDVDSNQDEGNDTTGEGEKQEEGDQHSHHKKKSTLGEIGSMMKKIALTPNPFNLHTRGNSRESMQIPDHQVKVYTNNKERSEFGDLRLVQELDAHEGAIWTMKFSLSGEHLASAGQSGVVMIWSVGENSVDAYDGGIGGNNNEGQSTGTGGGDGTRMESNDNNENSSSSGKAFYDKVKKHFVVASSSCPLRQEKKIGREGKEEGHVYDAIKLLKAKPFRQFVGHTAHVVDLAWHRDNFLLSASMDKTVRLWHITTNDCLHVFAHHHVVTSVDFHPAIDTCFLTGCFDKKLRIWSVIDGRVKKWAHAPDLITAACFNPGIYLLLLLLLLLLYMYF